MYLPSKTCALQTFVKRRACLDDCIIRISTGLRGFRMDIRAFKAVSAAVAGLALIVGIVKPVQADTLTVGAPPSLRPAFSEILPMYEREYGAPVHVLYTP